MSHLRLGKLPLGARELPQPDGRLAWRIGEDNPEEERLFRDLWKDETQREVVVENLKADCEVRTGRPPGL